MGSLLDGFQVASVSYARSYITLPKWSDLKTIIHAKNHGW